ncbi:asparagine synthase (glutamine-hydrolyzing), partial [Candidatus Pseudothioglobus singularis]|nr:asparagine synthase (glutamine-hydrolyzing) [Candidatus Pseudothioglobus singularis]
MCGIAALINFDNSYAKAVKQSLYHRGPDAQSHYQYKNLQFVHTRLSIQDIQHGVQPFRIGQYVIIFNGEIYNHLELRQNLKQYVCKTLSDTETLLALFIEFGISALELIDGMFAFIIHDIDNDKLIIGRDRLGKKPIYFYKNNKQVFFASELNVLSNSLPAMTINEHAIASYLRAGFFISELTPYHNVQEILPGHIYELHITSLKLSKFKYFDIADQYKPYQKISHQDALIGLDTVLHKSVKDRLLSSDLDVGAFLSGGIDSSLIVGVASQYVKNLKTFTVKFPGGYDESVVAASTANKFGTNHYELEVSMDLKRDIEKILTSYGEPFMDSSAIPTYYVSKEAKKYVSVVLNGDGADELFAGYRRYVPFANNWPKYVKYISILNAFAPMSNKKMSNYNYLTRLLRLSSKDGLDQYLASTTDIFEDIYSFGVGNLDEAMEEEINVITRMNFTGLSRNLVLDSKLLLANDLLKKMDIATMAHSLEARSPFLSKYMLEWVPKLPDQEKINLTKTKSLLRDLTKKYSLNELYDKPKRGFEVPLKSWVENDLKDNIYDSLNSANSYSKNYVNPKFIKSLLNNPTIYPGEKRSKILWSLYSLEVWHSSYIRGKNLERKNSDVHMNPITLAAINKINILFLTTGLGLGGAERVVYDICTNINKAKFEASVIGISSQKDMLNRFHKNKIHTYALN